jgi:integrase
MTWNEVPDFESDGLWTIPWFRHKIGKKTKKPIYKPLSDPAIKILKEMKAMKKAEGIPGDFVFAQGDAARLSNSFGKPMNDGRVRHYLARFFDPKEASVHGFRTTFGSWSDDKGYAERDRERALGHIAGEGENYTARLYTRHATQPETLVRLMKAWGEYCGRAEPLPGEIVQFPVQAK